MLKITEVRGPEGQLVLLLEGRLVGPWVEVLRRVMAERATGGAVTLDLGGLEFADREGLGYLRQLRGAGVEVVGTSDFVRVLLGGGHAGDSRND